jgi:hypothetical protein
MHLPADRNETQRINSEFFNIVGPARDLERAAAFAEVVANLESLHYDFNVINFRDEPSYIELHCDEKYEVYLMPTVDENNAELNIAQWYECPDSVRDYYIDYHQGVTGDYFYQAKFKLVLDEWDPVREAEFDLPPTDDPGVVEFGSVEVKAHDFQAFIEQAVFELSNKFDQLIHPKRIPLKREIA